MHAAIRCRLLKFRNIFGRLSSRYRYLSLNVSDASTAPSIWKGGTSVLLRTFSSFAMSSIAPVGILLLSCPLSRSDTLPFTAITHSFRKMCAFSWLSFSICGSNTIWVIPSLSLRSIKMRLPRSRRLFTQPIKRASFPSSSALKPPQSWLLFHSPSVSIFIYLSCFYLNILTRLGMRCSM